MDISDCAKLVVIARGTVVHDFESQFWMPVLILLTPFLEIRREFGVGHHINRFQIGNANKIVRQPLDDWFASDRVQRFRFIQRQRVETRGVPGSENQDVHETKTVRSKAEKCLCFSNVLLSRAKSHPSDAAESCVSAANRQSWRG